MNIIAQQVVEKQHFQLHFKPDHYVLYEEYNKTYRREKWSELVTCGGVKRVHYNTTKWRNYIIIDIDNDDIYKYKDSLPDPNFILKNKDKVGAHLFYVLDRGIYHENAYYVNMWQKVHKRFTDLAGGDPLSKGYVGKFVHSNAFEYIELEPFAYKITDLYAVLEFDNLENKINDLLLYDREPSKKSVNNIEYGFLDLKIPKPKPKQLNLDGFAVGERNDGLFNKTRKYAYSIAALDEEVFKEKVFEYIKSLNYELFSPLEESEIKATAKSIIKYCLKNKEKIINYNPDDGKNRGVMGLQFQPIEKSKKQSLGAEYANEQRKDKTLSKILETIEYLKSNDLKVNVSSIAKHSKISRPAIYRHKKNLPI